jgi:hypothetical protein
MQWHLKCLVQRKTVNFAFLAPQHVRQLPCQMYAFNCAFLSLTAAHSEGDFSEIEKTSSEARASMSEDHL